MTAEQPDRKKYWETELGSLGIDPQSSTEPNDIEELASVADNLKQTYYDEYKTAYSEKPDVFDYIV